MSFLTSLARAYDQMQDPPPYGFATAKISMLISVRDDGTGAVVDLRSNNEKRQPRIILVPQAVKRTAGVAPNFLWDKTAYVLGLTADKGKRATSEHHAFKACHKQWLHGSDDPGLRAFLQFLSLWTEDQTLPGMTDELLDQNAIFCYERDLSAGLWLHDRPEAHAILRQKSWNDASEPQICLVSGEMAPVARLHPSIKGVWGAHTSGASLVSFNLDAFTSYGHEQGDNAPTSEAAAFAYTTTLNRFLTKGSGHCFQIGDASTVFWAEGTPAKSLASEQLFFAMFGGENLATEETIGEDKTSIVEVKSRLRLIQRGTPLGNAAPDIDEDMLFHIIGLAPNAARLSVRFQFEGTFGKLVSNFQNHLEDLRLEPQPNNGFPAMWQYLQVLAVQGKRENVLPKLAGDWMRAILTGQPYPMTLFAITLMRLRSDGVINSLHAQILKSVLIRNLKLKVPMALDPTLTSTGYVLGRIFAIHEGIQRAALDGNGHTTIENKYYGAASAMPQKVFAVLDRSSVNNLAKLRKTSPGWALHLGKLLRSIGDLIEAGGNPIPVSLAPAEQAMFGIGYYHQRAKTFRKSDTQTNPVGRST